MQKEKHFIHKKDTSKEVPPYQYGKTTRYLILLLRILLAHCSPVMLVA
jgi:hypothetical protein